MAADRIRESFAVEPLESENEPDHDAFLLALSPPCPAFRSSKPDRCKTKVHARSSFTGSADAGAAYPRMAPGSPGNQRDMTIGKGDKVSWNTSQGETHGVTKERKVKDFTFDGQQFRASSEEPYWIVESAKSGEEAAHKESSIKAR